MPNKDVFYFKGFHVFQGQSGLKVNSDSVIMASWFHPSKTGSLLDIGCGTGVLSCILSHRFPELKITGIEIDPNAQKASEQSFEEHPNKPNLKLVKGDFLEYRPEKKFDNVICNPPYFDSHSHLTGSRATARQQGKLNLRALFKGINKVLTPIGCCAIVVPRELKEECEFLGLQENLYMVEELIYSGSATKPFDRCVLLFKRHYVSFASRLLIMFNEDGSPTNDYLNLVGNIYLTVPKRIGV